MDKENLDNRCWHIIDYDNRYRPIGDKKRELKNPEFVKLPLNHRGEGIEALLSEDKGLETFGVWCLLLQKATAAAIGKRGWLWNHRNEPATIAEIAGAIQMRNRSEVVAAALELLKKLGWMEFREYPRAIPPSPRNDSEQCSEPVQKKIGTVPPNPRNASDDIKHNNLKLNLNNKANTQPAFRWLQFYDILKNIWNNIAFTKGPLVMPR